MRTPPHEPTLRVWRKWLVECLKAASVETAELDAKISDLLPNLTREQVHHHSRLLLIGDNGWINQWDPNPVRPPEWPQWKQQAEWHKKVDHHNMAFLDGHVGFLEIKNGIYVDPASQYSVLPFKQLYELALRVQPGPRN